MQNYFDTHGVPVKPGLRELLDFLKANGCTCALATSSNRSVADYYLADTHLADYFSVLVCGDEVTRSKPDPQTFLLAMQKLGAQSPAQCAVFEDSRNGLLAGATAAFPYFWCRISLSRRRKCRRCAVQHARRSPMRLRFCSNPNPQKDAEHELLCVFCGKCAVSLASGARACYTVLWKKPAAKTRGIFIVHQLESSNQQFRQQFHFWGDMPWTENKPFRTPTA